MKQQQESPKNPLLIAIGGKRLQDKMVAGEPLRIGPSPIPDWSYIYIGEEVAMGCPAKEAEKYLNEFQTWLDYLLHPNS